MSRPTKPDFSTPPEMMLLSIARMLWKRKLLIALIWVVTIAGTIFYVNRLPAEYSAEAVILVDNQKIPASYVTSTVNTSVADRVNYIREQILSSRRLTANLDDLNLFPDGRQLTPEEFASRIRGNISVTIDKANANTIRIGYKGPVQNVVANVANRMASIFVEENIKTRTEMADGTLEFTESELQEAKQKLDDLADAQTKYKLEHSGELPSQQGQLGATIGRLEGNLQTIRDTIVRENQQLALDQASLDRAESDEEFQRQSDAAMAQIANDPGPGPRQVIQQGPNGPQVVAAPLKQSDSIARLLADARLHYGEEFPEVKRLKAAYAAALKAEAAQAEQAPAPVVATAATPGADPAPAVAAAPSTTTKSLAEIARLKQEQAQAHRAEQMVAIRTNMADRRKHIQQLADSQAPIQKQIAENDAKLRQLPIREQELQFLDRDQAAANAHYQGLLVNKQKAEMAKNMELRQKSESFTVTEPARVPQAPASPDRPLLAGIGSAVGLGVSALIGLLLEFRKGQILGEWELPKDVVILAHLPPIRIEGANSGGWFFRRSKAAAAIIGLGSLVAIGRAASHYVLGGS